MEYLRDQSTPRSRAARWIISCTLLATLGLLLLGARAGNAQDGNPQAGKKLPSGIYKVLREGAAEKAVLPTKDDETVAVNNHRYLKKDDKEPPVYLVVHKLPDVPLVLAEEPTSVKDENGLQIRLKLHADYTKKMEQFTRENKGSGAAFIIGGEVVTVHKIRDVITGGAVQVSICGSEEAGVYLLKQLKELSKKK
jgi:preprotein translocase subunit SecD